MLNLNINYHILLYLNSNFPGNTYLEFDLLEEIDGWCRLPAVKWLRAGFLGLVVQKYGLARAANAINPHSPGIQSLDRPEEGEGGWGGGGRRSPVKIPAGEVPALSFSAGSAVSRSG